MATLDNRQLGLIVGAAVIAILLVIAGLVFVADLGTDDDYAAPSGNTMLTTHDNDTLTLTANETTATDALLITVDNTTYTLQDPAQDTLTICSPTTTGCDARTEATNGTITVIAVNTTDDGTYLSTRISSNIRTTSPAINSNSVNTAKTKQSTNDRHTSRPSRRPRHNHPR